MIGICGAQIIQEKQKNFQHFLHTGGILTKVQPYCLLSLVQSPSTLVSSFAGNNPMVGMTVSVAVAVEEACK